jgi:hypothetical protein
VKGDSAADGGGGTWPRREDPDDEEARWERIAELIEGKTAGEVKQHYELLVEDVNGIHAGHGPLPTCRANEGRGSGGGTDSREKGSAKSTDQDYREGIAITITAIAAAVVPANLSLTAVNQSKITRFPGAPIDASTVASISTIISSSSSLHDASAATDVVDLEEWCVAGTPEMPPQA